MCIFWGAICLHAFLFAYFLNFFVPVFLMFFSFPVFFALRSTLYSCTRNQTVEDVRDDASGHVVDKIEAGLQDALKGRFWAGKGAVLRATVSLAKLAPGKLAGKIPGLVERFMKECGRGQASAAYARESVTQLGELLEASPEYDGLDRVSGMLQEFIGMSAISTAETATSAAVPSASRQPCSRHS